MPLKAVVGSLDSLDEALRDFYRKADDGRFYLDVEGVDDMPAVVGLKQKASTLLDEKKQLDQRLKAFGDLTPEKVEELREAAKKAGGDRVAELEAKLTQASENAQREIAAAKEAAEAERKASREYFLDAEVTRAISAQRGIPSLLKDVVKRQLDVQRDGDRFSVRVLGADGQPRIKDSQGNPFGVEDLVSELKGHEEYGLAFVSRQGSDTPPSGGGAPPGGAKTIASGDPLEFGRNIEGIAKGEVIVQ